ncbi:MULTISPECIES: hypothetical protein [Neorhizobium]|uniref:hypothetical protein n=1 Tax=Neorhizobium TaxID=1525371 RepID=UPI000CF86B99|nr:MULTISPECIES: hypothetical protein [Neorhizobium]
MSLLDDWTIFCSDANAFPNGHFANLFREHQSFAELKTIFAPFEQGEAATSRLHAFFEGNVNRGYWRPDENKRVSSAEALEIAAKFQLEVTKLLSDKNLNDLSDEILALPVSFVTNSKEVEDHTRRDDIIHADYVDFISDMFRDNYLVSEEIMLELKEAVYQLSTNLDVTRYLLSPLTSLANSFDEAYRLWSAGGVYCFMNDALEVSILPR